MNISYQSRKKPSLIDKAAPGVIAFAVVYIGGHLIRCWLW